MSCRIGELSLSINWYVGDFLFFFFFFFFFFLVSHFFFESRIGDLSVAELSFYQTELVDLGVSII